MIKVIIRNIVLIGILILFLLIAPVAKSQNVVVTDDETYTPESSAMLDVHSVSKGFLVPRMTLTQRDDIQTPVDGLVVFVTNDQSFYYYSNSNWNKLGEGAVAIWEKNGDWLYTSSESARVGIGQFEPQGKLVVKADASFGVNDTLFAVKDANGNPVFVVLPDGAKVLVNQTGKGTIGGFAVSGRTPGKAIESKLLHITPDSTRIYFESSGKGKIGGFAVSGRTPGKADVQSSLLNLFPDNYFIGHNAGLNTTGVFNSFFGYNSGQANTTGGHNIFLGYESGYMNDGGYNNIFFGNKAGYENTNADNNIFIGNEAGYFNHSGGYNIFLGYHAGYNNSTGHDNTFFGYEAGQGNTEGFYNVYIGYQSGYTSGFDGTFHNYRNVFIGPYTGYNSKGLSSSVFIGYEAGRNNENGARNTFVGGYAGRESTGYNNSFFGTSSGRSMKSGTGNTFIGSGAGYCDTTGYRNTYVGSKTGYSIEKGYRNVMVGAWAGQDKTGGDYNVLLGFSSGKQSEAASSNIFIGYEAGFNETRDHILIIENSSSETPLIHGNFLRDTLSINGDLYINGLLYGGTKGVNMADHVFKRDYDLETIEEHAAFIEKNGHLPAMTSAEELKKQKRYNLQQRNEQLLEELEKAHLYIEALNDRLKKVEAEKSDQEKVYKKISELELQNQKLMEEIIEIRSLYEKNQIE